MKKYLSSVALGSALLFSACTMEDQKKTEEIFKPETEKLNRIGDSAQVRIDKMTDSAKKRLDKIADSAEASLRRIADSGKTRINRIKDSIVDSEVDKIGNKIKDAIRGKKVSGSN